MPNNLLGSQPTLATALRVRRRNKVLSRIVPTTKDGQLAEIDAGQTEIYTYFTDASGRTRQVFAADGWQRVRMLLETAGQVAIGTRQSITPVLSGRGRLLPVGQEIEFDLKKGDRLYIAAEAVNRVSITIQRIAYGDRVITRLDQLREAFTTSARSLLSRATGQPVSQPVSEDLDDIPEMPCPPAGAKKTLIRSRLPKTRFKR